ncbi:restriction endonuclease subunit S [Paenibacillus sp. FSL L8-0494]|uniref:restriction endonuclease subunit S n=1 Tax=Paenibacillus sp. FSL L8-0494 TaxID=2975352 RepID=UPI0030F69BDB
MGSFNTFKFSELYKMSSGISSNPEQAGHGSPFLSFSTIFNNYFIPEELTDYMNSSKEEQEKYSIKKGDVFLTRTSETLNELAMSSVSLKDYPEATFSGFAKRLRPIQKEITYEKFMGFYLRSEYFRKIINNNATMTLRASFNENIFSYLKVHLPDYQTQMKIGDFLFELEEKKILNNKINKELEKLAKTIYDYWFVQFDFPDKNGKPYKTSGGKMEWNDKLGREIPVGWTDGVLSDIANITMGQSPPGESYNKKGEGMIFFQGCTDFGNRFPITRQFTTQPKRFAKEGDILLSVRAPVGTLNVAKENCCIGRGLAALNSKDNCIAYLFGAMTDLKQIFDRRNVDGTTFGSITKDDLFSLKVVKPDKDILNQYQKTMNPVFEKQNKIELENQQLSELRDWLLPMLMNGQVEVAGLEN